MIRMIRRYAILAALALPTAAQAQDETHAADNRSFADYVLDAVELGESSVAVSRKIRDRSVAIRREWNGEGAVTPEEERRHQEEVRRERSERPERGRKTKEHRGNGPPDWAPAHGYRRNFSDQDREELGAFTHRQVAQGVRGDELIESVRRAVDRVSRGEPVDERDTRRTRDGDRTRDSDRTRDGDRDRDGDRQHSTDRNDADNAPQGATQTEEQRRPHRGDYDHDDDGVEESYKGGRFGNR